MATQSAGLVLITGGSSGIGYELARQFAGNGFDLVINAEDQGGLDNAARDLQAEFGRSVRTICADLAEEREVERLYREATSQGPIAVLCANAGVGSGGGDVTQTDLHKELRLCDLNVRSQVHIIKLAATDMVRRGEGRILVTSSIAALMPGPYEAAYSASKAFLKSYGEAVRDELKEKGVTVTVMMPGPTETNFFHRAEMDGTKAGQDPKDDPEMVAHQGYEALMAGKSSVVSAGLKTKLQAAATNLMSDPLLAKVHEGLSKPQD